jgi:hypothetical protein
MPAWEGFDNTYAQQWLCVLGLEGVIKPSRMLVNSCSRNIQLGIRSVHRRPLSDATTSTQRTLDASFVSFARGNEKGDGNHCANA